MELPCEAYRCQNVQEGTEVYFADEERALNWARYTRLEMHEKYCVQKVTPDESRLCLCRTSDGKQRCAGHEYAATVASHPSNECTIGSFSNVFYEEIRIE